MSLSNVTEPVTRTLRLARYDEIPVLARFLLSLQSKSNSSTDCFGQTFTRLINHIRAVFDSGCLADYWVFTEKNKIIASVLVEESLPKELLQGHFKPSAELLSKNIYIAPEHQNTETYQQLYQAMSDEIMIDSVVEKRA
ncbi:MAG: hypothetical protein AAGI66_00995 [Cyanobacteria bacterium P01_H01_bin.74]